MKDTKWVRTGIELHLYKKIRKNKQPMGMYTFVCLGSDILLLDDFFKNQKSWLK